MKIKRTSFIEKNNTIKTQLIVEDKEDFPTNNIFTDQGTPILDGESRYSCADLYGEDVTEINKKIEVILEDIKNQLYNYRKHLENLKIHLESFTTKTFSL